MIQTIIAPTIHRAKKIERQNNNPLARSLTLENFIRAYYERYGECREIDGSEVQAICTSIFMKMARKHFDFVTPDGEAMERIASFMIDVKRNGAEIEAFGFSSAKHAELSQLMESYNGFLQAHRIADRADTERFVLESILKSPSSLEVFGQIIIDGFHQNGVHFETSRTQEMILNALRDYGTSMEAVMAEWTEPKFHEPAPAPFDLFDEVAAALKITRSLLEGGENVEDILIVTPAIDEYAPVFESMFEAYGVDGYTSIGTPLKALIPMIKKNPNGGTDERMILASDRLRQIRDEIEKTSERLLAMGIEYNASEAYEKAVAKARVKSRSRAGVLITEANQILSIEKIKHLIFVGTDMGHFPPSSKEDFLATTAQKEALLHANSVYLSSLNHYLQMKAVADNLYVVTASYKGKTKLARSHIVTDQCEPYDISGISALFELPRLGKRTEDLHIDRYLQMKALEQSPYDGFDAGGYTVKTLSASQLGSYAMCPRRYFFDRVLGITAPGKPEEGLEANDKGTIMHKCFELFAKDAKKGVVAIGPEVDASLKKHMLSTAQKAFQWFMYENELTETINHRLYFQELTRGLNEGDEASGVLSNFLGFITQNNDAIKGFKNSEFEMEFSLDRELKPVENGKPFFIKGYIDRVDINDDEVRIVDYKSKKAKGIDKNKTKQMLEFRDMQLSLYLLYTRKVFGDRRIESYLQTFNSDNGHVEFAKAATYEVGKEGEYVHYDEAFEKRLIERIYEIQQSMAEGDFHYDDSDDKHCEYCDFAVMCRKK